MSQKSSQSDFREFEAVSQDLFQRALDLGKVIPSVVAEITALRREAKKTVLGVMKTCHERRTEEIILGIGQKEDLLVDRIVRLSDAISNLHVQLNTIDFIGSMKDIVGRFDDLERFADVNEEKRTILASAVSVIKAQPALYKFYFALAHIPLFALAGAYQDASRCFLGQLKTEARVQESVEIMSRLFARDVVTVSIPCLATAKAIAELSSPQLHPDIALMTNAVNEFERIFHFERILNGLWTHSRFVDLAVQISEENIQQLTSQFLGAVALLRGQLDN
ncbi:MAG: hypothetical protein ABFS02_07360 [Pseudomonadota bacterium]